eukprot:353716-Chlamydomonas_euryale.AAC.14
MGTRGQAHSVHQGSSEQGCGSGAKAAPPSGGYRPKISSAFGGYARKVGPPKNFSGGSATGPPA